MLELDLDSAVIMDIGGGSVEFILTEDGGLKWCQSFPIGVGVLFAMFHKEEPISLSNYNAAKSYIKSMLAPLVEVTNQLEVKNLIGASGSFEVIKAIHGHKDSFAINRSEVEALIALVISSDYGERSNIKGVPSQRVKLIVVAMILVEVALEILDPKDFFVSSYAIKEGLISEL